MTKTRSSFCFTKRLQWGAAITGFPVLYPALGKRTNDARNDSRTGTIKESCRSVLLPCFHASSPASLLQRRIHVPVLENFFQIRPNAQVGHVIGDGRKSMRHALREDDCVARLYHMARISHHCAAARRAVQDGRHFAVWRG